MSAPVVSREDRRRLEEAVLCSLTDNLPSPDNLPVADTPPAMTTTPPTDINLVEAAAGAVEKESGDSRPVSSLSDEPQPLSPPAPIEAGQTETSLEAGPSGDSLSRPSSSAAGEPAVVDLTTSLTDPPTPLNDEKPSPGAAEPGETAAGSHAVMQHLSDL